MGRAKIKHEKTSKNGKYYDNVAVSLLLHQTNVNRAQCPGPSTLSWSEKTMTFGKVVAVSTLANKADALAMPLYSTIL